jgi:hypothetical protein
MATCGSHFAKEDFLQFADRETRQSSEIWELFHVSGRKELGQLNPDKLSIVLAYRIPHAPNSLISSSYALNADPVAMDPTATPKIATASAHSGVPGPQTHGVANPAK